MCSLFIHLRKVCSKLLLALQALHANAIKSLQRTSWYLNEQFNAEKPAAVLSTVAGVTEEVRKALKDV